MANQQANYIPSDVDYRNAQYVIGNQHPILHFAARMLNGGLGNALSGIIDDQNNKTQAQMFLDNAANNAQALKAQYPGNPLIQNRSQVVPDQMDALKNALQAQGQQNSLYDGMAKSSIYPQSQLGPLTDGPDNSQRPYLDPTITAKFLDPYMTQQAELQKTQALNSDNADAVSQITARPFSGRMGDAVSMAAINTLSPQALGTAANQQSEAAKNQWMIQHGQQLPTVSRNYSQSNNTSHNYSQSNSTSHNFNTGNTNATSSNAENAQVLVPIRQNFEQEMSAIRSDPSLTQTQRRAKYATALKNYTDMYAKTMHAPSLWGGGVPASTDNNASGNSTVPSFSNNDSRN